MILRGFVAHLESPCSGNDDATDNLAKWERRPLGRRYVWNVIWLRVSITFVVSCANQAQLVQIALYNRDNTRKWRGCVRSIVQLASDEWLITVLSTGECIIVSRRMLRRLFFVHRWIKEAEGEEEEENERSRSRGESKRQEKKVKRRRRRIQTVAPLDSASFLGSLASEWRLMWFTRFLTTRQTRASIIFVVQ